MDGLVEAVMLGNVRSLAVNVEDPAVRRVTLSVVVPATRAVLGGSVAYGSDDARETRSGALTRFQYASTPLTVILKDVPAVRAVGDPVFPEKVPGAAVSPGTRSCSFERRPGFTVTDALVLEEMAPFVTSLAVNV